MGLSYDDVLNLWGRKLLADRGHKVSAESAVTVDVTVEYSGGCDTCSYETAFVEISAEGKTLCFESYEFRDVLLELVAVAKEN